MAIIQIDSSYLEGPQRNTLENLLRIDSATLDQKVIDMNEICEGYIKLKVLNIEAIEDSAMIIMKELYTTYRLYQKIEREEIAEDKRKDLDNLLDIENQNQILRASEQTNKSMKKTTFFVYNSSSPSRVDR